MLNRWNFLKTCFYEGIKVEERREYGINRVIPVTGFADATHLATTMSSQCKVHDSCIQKCIGVILLSGPSRTRYYLKLVYFGGMPFWRCCHYA